VRGVANVISPSTGFHFICYCKDCQAFANFLERPDVLGPAGGTDIFQMPPGRVKIIVGTDALRCLHLTDKVLRWYTNCCHTPIGNTATWPGFPVIGMVHAFMDHDAGTRSRDEVLGPPLCRIFERSAIGPLPPNARSAVVRYVRSPRVADARLVDARTRPADAVLRRPDEGSACRAARALAE
jgi:Family of unknown function (DUF6151)